MRFELQPSLLLSKLRVALAAAFFLLGAPAAEVAVTSPDGGLRILLVEDAGVLRYSVTLGGRTVITPSPVGLTVDGIVLGEGVTLGAVERYETDESFPWHGAKSLAIDRSNGARIRVTHAASKLQYLLELRAYDSGVAFRHLVPGGGLRVPEEGTSFSLLAGSNFWVEGFNDHYEGRYERMSLRSIAPGTWAMPPLTVQLPDNGGYLAITEAALRNYSGMALQANGKNGFSARLGHKVPASYPFRLRYENLVEALTTPAQVEGEIVTPWRVILAGQDLNALVRSDVIHSLAPKPDPALFPQGIQTSWVKPGRALWAYLDGGRGTLEGMKEFADYAKDLGFEYNVLEGFWARWPEGDVKSLAEYSRQRGVGLFLWKHSRDLRTPDQLASFLDLCKRVGAVGAKIDFFDHEHKAIVDHYETILRAAAERQLLIDFHGANKPTGMERTWPNLVGVEGIRGMESRPPFAQHDATLPFTRMLAGLADYTPTHFGRRMADTTWAHQVANAILMPAPLLVYGAHPANILANPSADIIKSIPSVWDDTIALSSSEIGEVAVLARRKGDTWFLAVANGLYTRDLQIELGFLGEGSYQATLLRDGSEASSIRKEQLTVRRSDRISIHMPSGGGFVGRFRP